jgi:hypothetical protein
MVSSDQNGQALGSFAFAVFAAASVASAGFGCASASTFV